jgi:hypothetical protein
VVSSTSMKVANITAMATIQGLTGRGSDIAPTYLVRTVGVTDMPGRSK